MVAIRFSEASAGWLISVGFSHSNGCWALIGVLGWLAAVAVAVEVTDVVVSTLMFFLAFLSSFRTGFTAFPFLLSRLEVLVSEGQNRLTEKPLPDGGYIIMGGKVYPEAETQESTVCVFPLSADVMAYTLRRPNFATTFPGLWTMLMAVSSALKMSIGFEMRLRWPYNAPSFPKNSSTVSWLEQSALQ